MSDHEFHNVKISCNFNVFMLKNLPLESQRCRNGRPETVLLRSCILWMPGLRVPMPPATLWLFADFGLLLAEEQDKEDKNNDEINKILTANHI